jgi:hypothetical protein
MKKNIVICLILTISGLWSIQTNAQSTWTGNSYEKNPRRSITPRRGFFNLFEVTNISLHISAPKLR